MDALQGSPPDDQPGSLCHLTAAPPTHTHTSLSRAVLNPWQHWVPPQDPKGHKGQQRPKGSQLRRTEQTQETEHPPLLSLDSQQQLSWSAPRLASRHQGSDRLRSLMGVTLLVRGQNRVHAQIQACRLPGSSLWACRLPMPAPEGGDGHSWPRCIVSTYGTMWLVALNEYRSLRTHVISILGE